MERGDRDDVHPFRGGQETAVSRRGRNPLDDVLDDLVLRRDRALQRQRRPLPPSWRRQLHFSLCVVDQKESLCSVTKSTHGELSNSVLDWGFTELIPLATLHSPSHGYILDDTLQFTIQFERVAEDGSGRSSSTRPRTGQTQTLNPALNLVPHP